MAESQTRWWEFYAVRYSMGTVVGATALVFLALKRPEIQSILPGTQALSAPPLETSRLLLATVYGLIYCYIASAPILVFHAGRFLINPNASKKDLARSALVYSILPVLFGVGAYLASICYQIEGKCLFVATTGFLVLLLELEAVCVYGSVTKNRQMFAFYEQLDKRRGECAKNNGEIVESYRHLREHGNSFFIVFLEISLAAVMFEIQKLVPPCSVAGPWLLLLTIWIAPAVCVWLISTIFERRFSESGTAS